MTPGVRFILERAAVHIIWPFLLMTFDMLVTHIKLGHAKGVTRFTAKDVGSVHMTVTLTTPLGSCLPGRATEQLRQQLADGA